MVNQINSSDWLELRRANGWYDFVHEIQGNGKKVAIFCYTKNPFSYLLHYEGNEAHGVLGVAPTSITGSVDDNNIVLSAVKEVKEEAGIQVDTGELVYLGEATPYKASDTVYYLYGVDITGKEVNAPQGDGSRGEKDNFCRTHTRIQDLIDLKDPLNLLMFMRLIQKEHLPSSILGDVNEKPHRRL